MATPSLGPVLFADTDHPNVHGHVLLEAAMRLWALHRCDRKVTVKSSVRMSNTYAKIFRQLRVSPDRVVRIDRPIYVAEAWFPDLPIVRRSWLHPITWEIVDRLRHLALTSDAATPQRIFVSRAKVARRRLQNEAEVEQFFSDLGFAIVHPQDHPIEDQIRMFANAKQIAAVGGSGAHNAIFADRNAKILILSSAGWFVNADILISQVPGRLAYVFGEPTKKPLDKHRTQAPWTIIMQHVRRAVEDHFGMSTRAG